MVDYEQRVRIDGVDVAYLALVEALEAREPGAVDDGRWHGGVTQRVSALPLVLYAAEGMRWIGKLTGGLIGARPRPDRRRAVGVLLGHQFDEAQTDDDEPGTPPADCRDQRAASSAPPST